MANILNIDTSSSICSVALASDREIMLGFESSQKMDHSTSLAPFVEKCMEYVRSNSLKLDAISVVAGPGSYTGLRIGYSMAKGLAFGLDIPILALSSLEVMTVRAIFTDPEFTGQELIVPMMDARRLEVYTAVFDSGLKKIGDEKALILNENSFKDLYDKEKVIFIGDGTEKFKELYKGKNALWLGNGMPHAKYMTTLSEKKFKDKNFADPAYSTPVYLKEYQATTPKNKL